MSDKELLKIYSSAMYVLAFLDEWDKVERIGAVAKVYNTITKKHNNFHKQIHEVKTGKKKKYSKKCELFIKSSANAVAVWEETIRETKTTKISANSVIHNLFRLNRDGFERIYGLSEDVFLKLDNNNKHGAVFASCKIARILTEKTEELIVSGSSLDMSDIY
jgi:uncharacterized protein YcaQ